MKIPARLAVICSLLLFAQTVIAQSNQTSITESATAYAEQFVKAFKYSDWKTYLNLTYPGAVKYYGGIQGYSAHIQRARTIYGDTLLENPETVKVLQLLNDYDVWQCVIEKSRDTYAGGKRILINSYLVGRSSDDGATWNFFDVSFNSLESVAYIMPDIFGMLAIPQKKISFPELITGN